MGESNCLKDSSAETDLGGDPHHISQQGNTINEKKCKPPCVRSLQEKWVTCLILGNSLARKCGYELQEDTSNNNWYRRDRVQDIKKTVKESSLRMFACIRRKKPSCEAGCNQDTISSSCIQEEEGLHFSRKDSFWEEFPSTEKIHILIDCSEKLWRILALEVCKNSLYKSYLEYALPVPFHHAWAWISVQFCNQVTDCAVTLGAQTCFSQWPSCSPLIQKVLWKEVAVTPSKLDSWIHKHFITAGINDFCLWCVLG